MLSGQRHNDLPCRNQGFLIGQGNVLSRLNGGNGGANPHHAHNGCHQNLRFRLYGHPKQTLHAKDNLQRQIRRHDSQLLCLLLCSHTHQGGMKLPNLLFQKTDVFSGGQGRNLKVLPMLPHHIQGLGADGAGRAQNSNFFHE